MTRANFLTVERPLEPQPPGGAELRPHWCYANTLRFYDKNNKEVWTQEIPEADLMYHIEARGRPEFGKPAQSDVFYDRHFGWQLRYRFSHETAKRLIKTLWTSLRRQHPKLREEQLKFERKIPPEEPRHVCSTCRSHWHCDTEDAFKHRKKKPQSCFGWFQKEEKK